MSDFSKFSYINADVKETGVLPVDIVLGGGYSKGDMITLASRSGVGKSTTMMNIVKNLVGRGERCAYLDVERGIKKSMLVNMAMMDKLSDKVGDTFLLLCPTTFKDTEEILSKILFISEKDFKEQKWTPYDHIILDSVTALQSSRMREQSVEEPVIGQKARPQSAFLEKYKPILRETGATMWLINQMRTHIDTSFGGVTEEDDAGPLALKFMPDIRLRMEAGPVMKREEQTVMGVKEIIFGNHARIWAKKNRSERPEIKVDIPVVFGKGVSNVLLIKAILIANKVITGGKGGHFTVFWNEKTDTVRGTEELMTWIKTNLPALKLFLKEKGMLDLTKEGV